MMQINNILCGVVAPTSDQRVKYANSYGKFNELSPESWESY